jgi:hypothetical protein
MVTNVLEELAAPIIKAEVFVLKTEAGYFSETFVVLDLIHVLWCQPVIGFTDRK